MQRICVNQIGLFAFVSARSDSFHALSAPCRFVQEDEVAVSDYCNANRQLPFHSS
jgi:hypothetical protein